ncbi:HupE/UreJ family protein [Bradyrhizobium sp. ISRA443]|nr:MULTISPECIES: HupE/UreJ family protein [unclassified Bradyrhizobium]WGR95902.1 HupE/UreJ family protein [Bradyrhizobium sp. ISRA435]WGS02866.1 HupE/UreJ family protein [Bradyrhizobium sp. ISRA436]WGS09753.1 HupE/UreJ family protein [Bradyrhizobium sp. ISRA437]WGS16635.1 HupE/UreJ family protein [Bradyrhizobium sp. ISRA443]
MIAASRRISIAIGVLFAGVRPAGAHIVSLRLGDFYEGALHPLTDLQDLILWISLGVLAGSLGAARGRWLVLVFPVGLLTGLLSAHVLGTFAGGPAVNACMTLLVGLLLAAALRIPTLLLCTMAFVLAVTRGAANAGDLVPQTDRLLFAAGLAGVGYAVITLVMALTVTFRETGSPMAWHGIAIRALGGWIAAVGMMMTGLSLAS